MGGVYQNPDKLKGGKSRPSGFMTFNKRDFSNPSASSAKDEAFSCLEVRRGYRP
jgi:hypothetical protein